ncbi:hypothetical protein ACFQX6_15950 [Streptosporangium lutulentum]
MWTMLAVTVIASGPVTVFSTPAVAAELSRPAIASEAQDELGNSARNHESPAPAVTSVEQSPSPGDPPLPKYPGLPPDGPTRLLAVTTTPLPCDNNGADKTVTRNQVLTRARDWLNVGIPTAKRGAIATRTATTARTAPDSSRWRGASADPGAPSGPAT